MQLYLYICPWGVFVCLSLELVIPVEMIFVCHWLEQFLTADDFCLWLLQSSTVEMGVVSDSSGDHCVFLTAWWLVYSMTLEMVSVDWSSGVIADSAGTSSPIGWVHTQNNPYSIMCILELWYCMISDEMVLICVCVCVCACVCVYSQVGPIIAWSSAYRQGLALILQSTWKVGQPYATVYLTFKICIWPKGGFMFRLTRFKINLNLATDNNVSWISKIYLYMVSVRPWWGCLSWLFLRRMTMFSWDRPVSTHCTLENIIEILKVQFSESFMNSYLGSFL